MKGTQLTVLRYGLGWILVMLGLLWIVRYWQPGMTEALDEDSYLMGVLRRSFQSGFQMTLLGGWMALVPHAILLATLSRRYDFRDAYDEVMAWAQTVFTSLGFMGTIIGVSQAVAGLEQAMNDGEPGLLIAGLSTAFDTTFLGLGAALTIMLLRRLAIAHGTKKGG